MNILKSFKTNISILSASLLLSLAWAPAVANAADINNTPNTPNNTPATNDTGSNTSQTTELSNIISKGNKEIERRIANLDKLSSLISSSTKLNSTDKTMLISEVSTTLSGLTTLKTQLDSETTVTAARTDVQNIATEYRVYALVYPKIHLIKTADDQQITEGKLSTLAGVLQTRLASASTAGQNVTALQADLTSLNSSLTAAESISKQVETSVINLQATDYNSDHSLLSGYNTQLQTARTDIQSAYNDAKTIIRGLEALTPSSNSSSTTK